MNHCINIRHVSDIWMSKRGSAIQKTRNELEHVLFNFMINKTIIFRKVSIKWTHIPLLYDLHFNVNSNYMNERTRMSKSLWKHLLSWGYKSSSFIRVKWLRWTNGRIRYIILLSHSWYVCMSPTNMNLIKKDMWINYAYLCPWWDWHTLDEIYSDILVYKIPFHKIDKHQMFNLISERETESKKTKSNRTLTYSFVKSGCLVKECIVKHIRTDFWQEEIEIVT